MYKYNVRIIRIVDGDTVDVDVDLGMDQHCFKRIRLAGINTPERGQVGWAEATAELTRLLPIGAITQMSTIKDRTEKYGRYLGVFMALTTFSSVNELMIAGGYAVAY